MNGVPVCSEIRGQFGILGNIKINDQSNQVVDENKASLLSNTLQVFFDVDGDHYDPSCFIRLI